MHPSPYPKCQQGAGAGRPKLDGTMGYKCQNAAVRACIQLQWVSTGICCHLASSMLLQTHGMLMTGTHETK